MRNSSPRISSAEMCIRDSPFRLRHGDVLEKVLVHVGSNIRRRTPAGRTILDSVAVFLGVFAFQLDRHAKDHRTGYTD